MPYLFKHSKSKLSLQSAVTFVREQNPVMNFDLPSCITDVCLSKILSSYMTSARRPLVSAKAYMEKTILSRGVKAFTSIYEELIKQVLPLFCHENSTLRLKIPP